MKKMGHAEAGDEQVLERGQQCVRHHPPNGVGPGPRAPLVQGHVGLFFPHPTGRFTGDATEQAITVPRKGGAGPHTKKPGYIETDSVYP